MRSNIVTIIRKEFSKFFGDKRMVFTTLILPGLMIFLLYSLMGDAIKSFTTVDKSYVYQVYVSNMPDSIRNDVGALNFHITDTTDIEAAKSDIAEKEADMLIVFPRNFDADVESGDVSDAQKAPNVRIYYNSTSTESANAYSMMQDYLAEYESRLTNRFDINHDEEKYDLASDKDISGQIYSTMLPMLMMIFLFSGCLGIAPESIAGEKERGTIATLLVTPIKRSELAAGKIISVSALALLSGISSFAGTMLALPKLMGADVQGIGAPAYSAADYLLLLAVILTSILVIVSLISVVSAFAKTVKEATTFVMPLMVVVMLIGVTAMFGSGAPADTVWYLIPLYNSVQCMNGIFSFAYQPVNIAVSLAVNTAVAALLMVVLTKMFNSEKVMFSK